MEAAGVILGLVFIPGHRRRCGGLWRIRRKRRFQLFNLCLELGDLLLEGSVALRLGRRCNRGCTKEAYRQRYDGEQFGKTECRWVDFHWVLSC